MLIALLADSHDCLPKIDKAVRYVNAQHVGLVLHAGDYSAPFAADRYRPLKARLIGVFGNNDAMRRELSQKFAQVGHEIRGEFAEVKVDKLKIALTHGDEEELLKSITESGAYDVVVYGHTHETKVKSRGQTLVINPGEICGYLSGKSTLALLETTTKNAKIVNF